MATSSQEHGSLIQQSYSNPQLAIVDDGTPTISRLKRIMTGEEVILTTESVYALAESSSVAAPRPRRYADTDQFPLLDTHSFNPNLVGSTFSQTLTLRPKSPNVASGLHYTPPLDALNTFDPFSLLPDIDGEPVPKQLLIKYCECP
jgi:hypothetical protein